MQGTLGSLAAGARAAVAAVSGASGRALHRLPVLGHLTAADESRHEVPHLPETGYVGGDAIAAAAGKRVEDYLAKRSTKAYMRALVKDGTVSGEGDLIHQHGQGPFMHPKLALHLAQWANPAFASVVNGWVLRYIAADRSLADDVLRRAGAGGGGEALLGSSLTHTMREVPLLPDSQPQAGEEEEEEEEDAHPFLPSMEATASDAAAPSKAPSAQRSRQPAKAPPPPPPEEEEEPAEEEPAPTPVETPAPRRQRARTGAKTTATPARLAKAKTGRRRRAHREESFKIYIHKVLKQISPTLGISSKAMAVMDNMMSDTFEGLASEAALLMRKDNGRTLTAREMAAAVKMRFNGDLRAHAMSEGAKAVAKFHSSL